MKNSYSIIILAATAMAVAACASPKSGKVVDENFSSLRCEYLAEPICIDTQSPRLTWLCNDVKFSQKGYEVRVADSQEGLDNPLWTSGSVASDRPFCQMEDKGVLESDKTYYWQVTAWDSDSSNVITSVPATFRTAMMKRSDWAASWITDSNTKELESAPMFRKEFSLGKKVESAHIFTSACAYGLVSINGKQISDSFLDPGYTHYDKRNLYSVTDVTSLVKKGANAIGIVAGNGFYNEVFPLAVWLFENARWRDRARVLAELHVTYADGSKEVVGTDGSWKTFTDGPFVNNDIYAGDTYDARKAVAGWDKPGFDDSAWADAVAVPDPSPLLVARKAPAIRPSEELRPVNVQSFGDSVYVFDFGANISGLCRLNVCGPEGAKVSVAHAELLDENGRLTQGNINIFFHPQEGYAFQTDNYVLSGKGKETWTPSFCYHGFRYAEVKTDKPLKSVDLTALHFHTDFESAGTFECSNPKLNKLWEVTRRTYLNNFMSIPTDCPQREKNGWTADAYLSQEIGLMNYDGILAYEKWLDDFIDNQRPNGSIAGIIPTCDWGYDDWIGPVWDAAMFIIPWNLYLYYGDETAIRKIWPACVEYLKYLGNREDADGLVTYGIGDWLPYETQTPTQFTSPLFYFYDNTLMVKFAEVIGEDPAPYQAKASKLQATINKKWYDPKTGFYAGGTQAAQAASLYCGLVPEEEQEKVAAALDQLVKARDCQLDFGAMGTKTVPRMLTKYGYVEDAFKMVSKESHPSWISWLEMGFTSLAETWNICRTNEDGKVIYNDSSLDHIFFGDVVPWLVNDIVGIAYDPSEPGFGHVLIKPAFVEGLDWAKATYNSVRGEISVGWEKDGDNVTLNVDLPSGVSASVYCKGNVSEVGAGHFDITFKL